MSAGHLADDRLYDCYLSARSGERLAPPLAEHLADCGDCAGRYARLTELLNSIDADAAREADRVFTPERLQLQQQAIARRLQHVGRAARVITFPGHPNDFGRERSRPAIVLRWAAVAAAAGIVIGLGAGIFIESGSRAHEVRQSASLARSPRLAPNTAGFIGSGEAADDRFMTELESALDRPRTRELAPFDALTPHVREVSNVR